MKRTSRLRSRTAVPLGGLLALLLLAAGGCREAERPEVGQWMGEGEAEAEVLAAEEAAAERARLEEEARLAAAERERLEAEEELTAQREALLAEREEQARREEELAAREARLAARRAELEQRERRLAATESELNAREFQVTAREGELEWREEEAAAPRRERVVEPARAMPPSPRPERAQATLLPGKVLEVEILETLSSRTHRVGDAFPARLVQDLRAEDGTLVIPAGAEVVGEVVHVKPRKAVGGRAELGVEFTHVVVSPGQTVEIRASLVEMGADKRGKDTKKVLIATAAGAILGQVLEGHTGGTLAGAAVGAAAGTAVVATAKDKDAEIPRGEKIALQLEEVVTVTFEMTGPAGG